MVSNRSNGWRKGRNEHPDAGPDTPSRIPGRCLSSFLHRKVASPPLFAVSASYRVVVSYPLTTQPGVRSQRKERRAHGFRPCVGVAKNPWIPVALLKYPAM